MASELRPIMISHLKNLPLLNLTSTRY
jgi:hypothetical protein